MSDEVFPEVRWIAWSVTMRPIFNTIDKKSANGKRTAAALYPEATWEFDLTYEAIPDDLNKWPRADEGEYSDLELLVGFFLDRKGSLDSFLWKHPNKNTCRGVELGVSDGTTTQFQAYRDVGKHLEPVQAVNTDTLKVYDSEGNQLVVASVSSTGLITLSAAAVAGAVTADFEYYFRVYFKEDSQDFENFIQGLYTLKQLTLVQEPQ